jgi:hypothetical protein
MLLLIIAGLYALIFAKITITKKLRLRGMRARSYGVTLIILSFLAPKILSYLLNHLLSPAILFNAYFMIIINLVCSISIAVLLAILFKES